MNLSYYPIHTGVLQVTKERERERMNIMCTSRKGARIDRNMVNKAFQLVFGNCV